MKAKKTSNEQKPRAAAFPFSCGDFREMAEMMRNCCSGGRGAVDCCSVMKRMMGRGKRKDPKETQEAQKPSKI